MFLGRNLNKEIIVQKLCAVCHTRIDSLDLHFISRDLSIVCVKCHDKFSSEDLNLIIKIFKDFGGYFGQDKEKAVPVKNLIKQFLSEMKGKCNINELNLQLLHKSLLYGISPQEHLRYLRIILDHFF